MHYFRFILAACTLLGSVLNACSNDTPGSGRDAGGDGETPPASSGGTGGKSNTGGANAGGANNGGANSGGSNTGTGGVTTPGAGGKSGASAGGSAGAESDAGGGRSGGSGTPDAGSGSDAGGDGGLVAAVTGVGAPIAGVSAPSASIGAAGGTLTSGDNQVTLTVPAGALTSATSISITAIANTAPGGTGFAYRFTPDGLTFAKPVTITLKPTYGQVDGSSLDHVQLAFQDAQHRWQLIPVKFDKNANTVSATTTHFTDYAYLLDLVLSGDDALFVNTGTELRVLQLHTTNGWAALVGPAQTGSLAWQLDGTQTGNGSDGNLMPLATSAGYVAPAMIPSTNPVAISVSFTASNGPKVTLVQNIHILAHKYRFTATLVNDPTCTGGSGYSYNYSTSGSADLNLDASFSITSSNPGAATTPSISGITVCPPAQCTATAEPTKTTGLTLTTVTGAWDHSMHRLRIVPRGNGSSAPSMNVDCGAAGSHEIIAGANAWNIPGYGGFMEGKDGEMVSNIVNLASGQAGQKFQLAVVQP